MLRNRVKTPDRATGQHLCSDALRLNRCEQHLPLQRFVQFTRPPTRLHHAALSSLPNTSATSRLRGARPSLCWWKKLVLSYGQNFIGQQMQHLAIESCNKGSDRRIGSDVFQPGNLGSAHASLAAF
jgi:hypothetical protein